MADEPHTSDDGGIAGDVRRTRALGDVPATADAFGGHARVADAIVELVRTEPGGRTIGLEGGWGSGKSTIVRLACDQLDENFEAFVFDAWSHEGDPLRRSFLEGLIDQLIGAGWVDGPRWRSKVEILARRRRMETHETTQDLTPRARWLAASLFVIPIGTGLLSRWLDQDDLDLRLVALATAVTAFPLLLASLFLVRSWWARRKDPTAADDDLHPLALLGQASKVTQQSETIETPEPTSLEFAREFELLLAEALEPADRRLMVVLDNLDRVTADTAAQLLSTLQTFISSGSPQATWRGQTWVLLPYDRDGLGHLWDDPALVDQFLGKIRQIRFEAPPLVLSDWRSWLRALLGDALPDSEPTELDEVVRVIGADRIDSTGAHGADNAAMAVSPTPRELVQLVNELGSIHRQRSDLPLEHLAYYACLRRRQVDVASALLNGTTPSPRVSRITGATVRSTLAALHFNVELDRAEQLLLAEPLSTALLTPDGAAVSTLASYPGFWDVLDSLRFLEWAANGGSEFAAAAGALSEAQLLDQLPEGLRRTLLDVIRSAESWRLTSAEAGDGLGALLGVLDDSAETAVRVLAAFSDRNGKENLEAPVLRGRVAGLVAFLRRLEPDGNGVVTSSARVAVPGDANQFLIACDHIAQDDPAGMYWRVLQPSVALNDVMQAVASWAGSAPGEGRSRNVLRVVASDTSRTKWDPVIDAFSTVFRDATLVSGPPSDLALNVLDVLEDVKEGAFSPVAAEGWLLHLLHSAVEQAHHESAALTAFLYLEDVPEVAEPPANGNAAAGAALLREVLATPDSRPEFAAALTEVVASRESDVVFDVLQALPSAEPWAMQCLQDRARTDRLAATIVVARWDTLDRLVPDEDLNALLLRLIDAGALLEATRTASAGEAARLEVRVLSLLAGPDESPVAAGLAELRTAIVERLRSLTSDDWLSELTAEGPSVDLLRLVADAGIDPSLGVPFQNALVAHGAALAAGTCEVADPARLRELLSHLSADHFRSAVLNGLISESARLPGPIAPAFIDSYGSALLEEPQVHEHDQLLSSVLASAVASDNEAMLAWAADLLASHPAVIDSIQSSEKVANFRAQVEEALRGESPSASLERLGTILGVSSEPQATEESE
jgi:hypothetical protein